MEAKPDKIKNEKNRIYTITVRFNKKEYDILCKAHWQIGKYLGIIAREATFEFLKNHYGIIVPDDDQKTI